MFAVRRYKKALYALPLISFAVASLIHVGASFSDKRPSSYSQPAQPAGNGFAPAPAPAPAPGRDSSSIYGGNYGVLRARFQKINENCAKPISFHFGESVFDAKSVSTMAGFLREEILSGARSTPGMGIHAFFVSPSGAVPPVLAGFQKLADSIPGGIGVISQTPAGMNFAPGREQSAKLWLSIIASQVARPDPAGMFGIVIEPPLGGCGAIK